MGIYVTWIKDHTEQFILPNMGVRSAKPSAKCKWPEMGQVYSALRSRGGDKKLEDLCIKISEGDRFSVYELATRNDLKNINNHVAMQGCLVLHSFVKATLRKLKKERKILIFPGRDAWTWAVLAAKMGIPHIYDPRLSRAVATNKIICSQIIYSWNIVDWDKVIFFDTGYAGSIPKALANAAGLKKFNMIMASASDPKNQVFPGHTGSRAKVLASEYMSKYRQRAVIRNLKIHQPLSQREEFIKCALYTIWLWYCVSPKRVATWSKDDINKQFISAAPSMTTTLASNTTGTQITVPTNWAQQIQQQTMSTILGTSATTGSTSTWGGF